MESEDKDASGTDKSTVGDQHKFNKPKSENRLARAKQTFNQLKIRKSTASGFQNLRRKLKLTKSKKWVLLLS